jgi:negative regulator of flagellin synthesis FlgM
MTNSGEVSNMRIDFQYSPQAAAEADRARSQPSAADNRASVPAASIPQDQAQLSGAHVQVQALASQASQLPEVREERVQALRQAIQSGHYRFDPESIASSLLDHMALAPAT